MIIQLVRVNGSMSPLSGSLPRSSAGAHTADDIVEARITCTRWYVSPMTRATKVHRLYHFDRPGIHPHDLRATCKIGGGTLTLPLQLLAVIASNVTDHDLTWPGVGYTIRAAGSRPQI